MESRSSTLGRSASSSRFYSSAPGVPPLPWLGLREWEGGEEPSGQCQGVAAGGTFLSSALGWLAVSQKGSEVRRCSEPASKGRGEQATGSLFWSDELGRVSRLWFVSRPKKRGNLYFMKL